MTFRNLLPILILGALLITCGDDNPSSPTDDPPENPNTVSQEIGPDGGEIASSDGDLTLTFPEGALPSPETISITPLSEDELGEEFQEIVDSLGIANAYEMGPDGLEFDEPVTATTPSDQNSVLNDSTLQLSIRRLMFTSSDGQVELLDSLRMEPAGDGSGNMQYSGELSHFSTFAATGTDESGILTATISGIPEQLQVGQEKGLDMRADISSLINVRVSAFIPATPFEDVFRPAKITSILPLPEVTPETENSNFAGGIAYFCQNTGSNPVRGAIGTEISDEQTGSLSEVIRQGGVLSVLFNFTDFNRETLDDGVLQTTTPTECIEAMPETFKLLVQKDGAGDGTVTSDPPGIDFVDDNTEEYEEGTEVTLTASPDENSTFNGWSGDIGDANAQSETITVIMNQDRDITATFNQQSTSIRADMNIGFISSPVGGIPAGETGSVTVEAENQGPDDAPDTAIRLEMDNGRITAISGNENATCDAPPASEVGCSFNEDIPAGEIIELIYDFEAEMPGTLTLSSTVSSDAEDPNPDNNSDEVEVNVEEKSGSTDLAVDLTSVKTPIEPGQTGTASLNLLNNGPDVPENAEFIIRFEDGMITRTPVDNRISCDPTPAQEIDCTIENEAENFQSGDIIILNIEYSAQTEGTRNLSAEISAETEDPEPSNNSNTEEVDVEGSESTADLAIGLDKVDTQIAPGETGTARLSVVNFGPDTPKEAGFVFRFVDGAITGITDDPAINCTNPPSVEVGCNIVDEENFDTNSVIEFDVEYSAETEGTRDLAGEILASSNDPDESNNSIAVEVDVQEPNEGATELPIGLFGFTNLEKIEGLFQLSNSSSSGSGNTAFRAVSGQNQIEETQFGDLSGKLPVVFSGATGFIVKDLLTGEILSEQFASAGAPAFGVIGLTETPRGPDSPATIVLFGETGIGFYSANFSGGTQSGNQPVAFDAFPAGGNAESSYGVSAFGGSVRYIDIEEGDSRHLLRSLFDELAPSAEDFDGQVVSAWMPDDGTPNNTPSIVLDRDTDPNNNTKSGLYFLPRGDANNAPTPQRLADVGLDARKVRCQDLNDGNFLCAVTVFGEDKVELFIWDGGTTLNSAATVSIGNGPVDLQLRDLPGGNFGLVTTGFNDNTYTVAELAPDGSVLTNNTVGTPSGCQSPAHAIFVRDAASLKVVGTCFDSGNYFIIESGL